MRWLRRLAIDVSPLRSSREFRLLWSGSVVSAIGSQFARVGLYVQVYALTGSPAAVGLLGVSGLIGSFGGVLVGSAFIDRHDRRVTLIWTELAAVGVSGVLFAGALAGDPPLWLLHAANAATWFLASIHGPARQAAPRSPGRRSQACSSQARAPRPRMGSTPPPTPSGSSRRSCFAHCPQIPSRPSVAWPRSRTGSEPTAWPH